MNALEETLAANKDSWVIITPKARGGGQGGANFTSELWTKIEQQADAMMGSSIAPTISASLKGLDNQLRDNATKAATDKMWGDKLGHPPHPTTPPAPPPPPAPPQGYPPGIVPVPP